MTMATLTNTDSSWLYEVGMKPGQADSFVR
jgi:hypothetical protein